MQDSTTIAFACPTALPKKRKAKRRGRAKKKKPVVRPPKRTGPLARRPTPIVDLSSAASINLTLQHIKDYKPVHGYYGPQIAHYISLVTRGVDFSDGRALLSKPTKMAFKKGRKARGQLNPKKSVKKKKEVCSASKEKKKDRAKTLSAGLSSNKRCTKAKAC